MATIIRQSYIDKIERYLGKGDSHRRGCVISLWESVN